jgi:O-acetyl-ADP-ribose deacetylase (regulator of RNase III)
MTSIEKESKLDFLIKKLLPKAAIPVALQDKMSLFRSLVNTHEANTLDDDFLLVQDELLQALISEKGITDISKLKPIKDELYLWRGDITTLKVDAIVNAANSGMLGCFVPCHSCIDNAIHTFAGAQLRLECAKIMQAQGYPEATGKAKITKAYNLPSKYIIHTVGPIVRGKLTGNDRELLEKCYRSCLEIAEQNEIESVAFCCISTGEFHFPNDEAARIAVDTVVQYMKTGGYVKKVIFDVFTERDERLYENLLG